MLALGSRMDAERPGEVPGEGGYGGLCIQYPRIKRPPAGASTPGSAHEYT